EPDVHGALGGDRLQKGFQFDIIPGPALEACGVAAQDDSFGPGGDDIGNDTAQVLPRVEPPMTVHAVGRNVGVREEGEMQGGGALGRLGESAAEGDDGGDTKAGPSKEGTPMDGLMKDAWHGSRARI